VFLNKMTSSKSIYSNRFLNQCPSQPSMGDQSPISVKNQSCERDHSKVSVSHVMQTSKSASKVKVNKSSVQVKYFI
jgi:hypothetical protein